MLFKYIFSLLTLLVFSLGCSQHPISGHIDTKKQSIHNKVYLIDPLNFRSFVSSFEGKVIDSASIDASGNFYFNNDKLSEPEPKIYLLVIQEKQEKYPNKLLNEHPDSANYIPIIYIPGKHIIVHGDAVQLTKSAVISGDISENEQITKLISTRSSLFKKYMNEHKNHDEENLLEQEKAIYNYQNELINVVSQSKEPYIHALALRWASPNGDYERIPELVKQTCVKMRDLSPGHPWTAQVCQQSARLPLTISDTLPNFEMPMLNGENKPLYSLLGSKITIVDLWASWCAPCRKENRATLVPLWDAYHASGLEIVGYALDSSHKGWENAIIKDGSDRWKHASHLEGDVSPFLDKIHISTIPANYITDSKGVILAKNLHGDELFQWVQDYMKKN
ncbi:MAG TPA: TlpA disulfide reductase family protein [Saprospiraceae bacterium]|nr:TlpA family protein disulfide reductase [Saprospiraceae bacterium]HRO09487.1 TlpA disulfide reductase family protein [Saprospiraceae bacterium]HRP42765.1 TlpA disulfide reductase family protein [Saprospiraceae bacterium]